MIIPSDWKQILTLLHNNGFPEAIIAGGCLRDLDNSKPVKDIDVFVVSKGPTTTSKLDVIFNVNGDCMASTNDSDTLHPLAEVWEYSSNFVPLQIIIMPEGPTKAYDFLVEQLNRFDIGLCRIGYDGVTVVRHEAYNKDKKDKTLTMLHQRTYNQSIRRLSRIGLKYPDFQQIVYL
jgi:hypothetical protein